MSKSPAKLEKPLRINVKELRWLDVDEFLANPDNWRVHPDAQQQGLAGAIDDTGFNDALRVNMRTSEQWPQGQRNVEMLLDGHARITILLRSAQEQKLPRIPALMLDLTPAEEAEFLATFDPLGAMAGSDKAKLDELLRQVQTDDARVMEALAEIAKENGLEYGEPSKDDPGAQIDKAEELRVKWGVELGQLWQLGKHRLICGDCTVDDMVEYLMQDEQADMVFTDAPYNVAIVGGTHDPRSPNFQSGKSIDNDNMTDDEFDDFLIAFMSRLPLREGGAFYLCAPAGRPETQFRNALDSVSGLGLRECIVWVKDTAVFGRQDYHWRHESILYGWRDGAAHYFTDNRTDKNTVWEIPRPKNSDDHPTMKPIELVERAIENSSKPGWIVYDGFLGSGTTLIACERLNRQCRAVEISSAYCAVAIQRWVDLTGGIPEKLN